MSDPLLSNLKKIQDLSQDSLLLEQSTISVGLTMILCKSKTAYTYTYTYVYVYVYAYANAKTNASTTLKSRLIDTFTAIPHALSMTQTWYT